MATITAPVRISPPVKSDRREFRSGNFRSDIEGLRAVAVLAVVLYHAGLPGLSGGFIGVDVFFVISGFLITGLLWREISQSGTVSLGRFYAARARRLLPASCLVLACTAAATLFLIPPLQVRSVLWDVVASALYLGNYRLAIGGTDYLNADALVSPVQHYWSLGVEEQFYFVWPALMIAVAILMRKRLSGSARPFAIALLVVAAASMALSLNWTTSQPSWAYFSLPTRAWELAVGGLVALTVPLWRTLPALSARVAGWGGLLLILAVSVSYSAATPFPGSAAVIPVLATALVIGAGCAPSPGGVTRLLSDPRMRAIGRVSYSWYLWHWPVLILAPYWFDRELTLPERLAAVAFSFGLAVATLHLIENPMRFSKSFKSSAKRSLKFGGALTAVTVVAALVMSLLAPNTQGSGAAAATLDISGAPAEPSASKAQLLTRQVHEAVVESAKMQKVPSNLDPTLAQAPGSKADAFVNGCVRSWLELGQSECATGAVKSSTTVALVGDSHAAMWSPALDSVAKQRNWRIETMAKVTCPLMPIAIRSPYLGRKYTECESWRADVMKRLQKEKPELIVLDMARRYGGDFGFKVFGPKWLDGISRLVSQLRATGAEVILLGPIPDPGSTVPTCLSSHLDDVAECTPARSKAMNAAGISAEAAATTKSGGRYVDLSDLFCTTAVCPVIVGNGLVFRDDNHLTVEHAEMLGPVVGALADEALAG